MTDTHTHSVKKIIDNLFLLYGQKLVFQDVSKRRDLYIEMLKAYEKSVLKSSIGEAIKETGQYMPEAITIKAFCSKICRQKYSSAYAAGDRKDMRETHSFNWQTGKWINNILSRK